MKKRYTIILTLLLVGLYAWAGDDRDTRPYLLELGAQAGLGYYVGDAAEHIFMQPSWVAGGQFRYKPTPRWAFSLHGMVQELRIPETDKTAYFRHKIVDVDVTAEFNFFRFGSTRTYDERVKAVTPYMFLGIGCGVFKEGKDWTAAAYMPFGFGMKARLSQHIGLNLRWQHNLYFADNIEGLRPLNNQYELNGSNPFNCDLTSQLVLGFVVEFARQKKICRYCR